MAGRTTGHVSSPYEDLEDLVARAALILVNRHVRLSRPAASGAIHISRGDRSFCEIPKKNCHASPDQGIDSPSVSVIQPKEYRAGSRLLVAASVWLLSAGWAVISASTAQDVPAPPNAAGASDRAVLDRYCVTCHNQRTKASGLALDGVDVARPGANGEIWEDVVRKLRTRSMPPQGVPRPDEASYNALATFLETELDRAGAGAPNPGRPLIRRLNRSEYANSVRELLALDIDVSSLLPPDDAAFGFDNNADLLGTSPALLEKYRGRPTAVSALAVGAPVLAGLGHVSDQAGPVAGPAHRRSSALDRSGGLVVNQNFPLDAEYHFSLALSTGRTSKRFAGSSTRIRSR